MYTSFKHYYNLRKCKQYTLSSLHPRTTDCLTNAGEEKISPGKETLVRTKPLILSKINTTPVVEAAQMW